MAYQETKKLLMVNPVSKRFSWGNVHFPSLGLPLLAASGPDWLDIELVDEFQTALNSYPYADLVAISVLTAAAVRAYEIGDHYRELGIPVVMGGMHVSALPDEALLHADAVVIGEADELWALVLDDFKEGRLKRLYSSTTKPDVSLLPQPRWDLVRAARRDQTKEPIYSVQAGRGCPGGCTFCNVPDFFGRVYRRRNLESVLRDIEAVGRSRLLMVDDNLLAGRDFARELLSALKDLGKEWFGLSSLAYLDNDEILDALAASGCRHLFIGFETSSQENLAEVGKGSNMKRDYAGIIRRLNERGIRVIGSFIVGLDHDTEAVFDEMYDFIERNDIYVPIVNILTPYPGTRLRTKLEAEGRIISNDWSRYSCDEVVFKPKLMSPETLKERHHGLSEALLKRSRQRFSSGTEKSYGIHDF